jgi:hypothetical protein
MRIPTTRSLVSTLLATCVLFGSAQRSLAESPCPVMVYDGKISGDAVSISFMDMVKIPIRQLVFSCATLQGKRLRHFDCHTDPGIFFPGIAYTMSLTYAHGPPGDVYVSVETVVGDRYIWRSTHDQTCRTLKIRRKHD